MSIEMRPLPQPTEGEQRFHEDLVDSGKYALVQERRDALRVARIGVLTDDSFAQEVGLLRWNRTFPNEPWEQYSTATLLIAVAQSENEIEG